jgi:hypothetical protein
MNSCRLRTPRAAWTWPALRAPSPQDSLAHPSGDGEAERRCSPGALVLGSRDDEEGAGNRQSARGGGSCGSPHRQKAHLGSEGAGLAAGARTVPPRRRRKWKRGAQGEEGRRRKTRRGKRPRRRSRAPPAVDELLKAARGHHSLRRRSTTCALLLLAWRRPRPAATVAL